MLSGLSVAVVILMVGAVALVIASRWNIIMLLIMPLVVASCLMLLVILRRTDPDWARYDTMRVEMKAAEFNEIVNRYLMRKGIDTFLVAAPNDGGYVGDSDYKLVDSVSELAIYTREDCNFNHISTLVSLGKKKAGNEAHMNMFKKLVIDSLVEEGELEAIQID